MYGKRLANPPKGLKIRAVQASGSTSASPAYVFPLPKPLTALSSLSFFPLASDARQSYLPFNCRMASFICNSPDATAYSAFYARSIVLTYAHKAGDNSIAMYRDLNEMFPLLEEGTPGTWVYFPMGPGERVIHVFRRRCDMCPEWAGLLLQPNRNRTMTIGRCFPPRDQPGWVCLFS